MPWINARGDYPPGAICTNVIDEGDMTYFYRKLLH